MGYYATIAGDTIPLGDFKMADELAESLFRRLDSLDNALRGLGERMAAMEQAEKSSQRQRKDLFDKVGELHKSMAKFESSSATCEKICEGHETRLSELEDIASCGEWDSSKAKAMNDLLAAWGAVTSAFKAALSKVLIGVFLIALIGAATAMGVKIELPK